MLLCVYFKVWYLVSVSAKLLAICLPQRSNSSNQTCCIWNISFANLRNFAQFVGGFCVYSGVLQKMQEKQSWRGSKQSVQLSLELAVETSMSTMAVIWVSLFCLGSIFPQSVLGIDLSFSILASFWLHDLHFTACSCSS
jgi:hypothetical protein